MLDNNPVLIRDMLQRSINMWQQMSEEVLQQSEPIAAKGWFRVTWSSQISFIKKKKEVWSVILSVNMFFEISVRIVFECRSFYDETVQAFNLQIQTWMKQTVSGQIATCTTSWSVEAGDQLLLISASTSREQTPQTDFLILNTN